MSWERMEEGFTGATVNIKKSSTGLSFVHVGPGMEPKFSGLATSAFS